MSALDITSIIQNLGANIADIESKDIDVRVQEVQAYIDKNKGTDQAKSAVTLLEALLLFLRKLSTKPAMYLRYSHSAILDDLDEFVKLLIAAHRGEKTNVHKIHIRSIFVMNDDELVQKLSQVSIFEETTVDSVVRNELPANLERISISSSENKEVFTTKLQGTSVAVKLLKPPNNGVIEEAVLELFRKEIKIATSLSYPTLVQVLGAYVGEKGLAIVMELHAGNLRELLSSGPIPLQRKLRMAKEIADGLVFLHNYKPTILHRNLSSQHVLFNNFEEHHCKVAGFGVAKFATDPKSILAQGQASKGIAPYKAPELWSIKGSPAYSDKSDVYAFGVLLWEIMGQKEPRAGVRAEDIAIKIRKGELETIPPGIPAGIEALIKKCLDMKPENRPTMVQVSGELQDLGAPTGGDEVSKLQAEIVQLRETISKQAAQIDSLQAQLAKK